MSGLTAPPPTQDAPGQLISVDDWFPPVGLDAIRDTVRIGDGVVTTRRLVAAIEGALLTALRDLTEWQKARVAEGALSLEGVPAVRINGISAAVALWDRIVRYYTAAELADTHRDISATDDGLDRAEEKTESADVYRRLAYHAVADLRSIGGEPEARNRVSLI